MTDIITHIGQFGDGMTANGTAKAGLLPGETEGKQNSAQRITPPCKHFGACGGCKIQYANDELLAEWKLGLVKSALDLAGVETPKINAVLQAPAHARRRATFVASRTKKTTRIGFYAQQSNTQIDIENCHIIHPDIMAGFPLFHALTKLLAPRKNPIHITVTMSDTGLDILIKGSKEPDLELREKLAIVADEYDLARLTLDEELIAMRRPPSQNFGLAHKSVRVVPPAGAFLQAVEDSEQQMAKIVTDALKDADRVADLFAGCGTFALRLAEHSEVIAVEGEKPLTAAMATAWRASSGLKKLAAVTRDLFRRPLLAVELNALDGLVFDPPRAGAEAQASEIAKSTVPVVVGVSCNPVTFARDAKILQDGGYELSSVTPIDQFRWTPHIEIVAVFKKDKLKSNAAEFKPLKFNM